MSRHSSVRCVVGHTSTIHCHYTFPALCRYQISRILLGDRGTMAEHLHYNNHSETG